MHRSRSGGPHLENSNFLNVHSKTVEIIPRDMPQIFCRTPLPGETLFAHASIKCAA